MPLRTKLALLLLALLVSPARAAVGLQVVTTTEGLGALAREVGGARVEVTTLARGTQDPHFVDASPVLAVKLRNADLLVDLGLDLEAAWLPPLVTQSRNAEIQPGGRRRLTAASAVTVLDLPTGPVDRSRGDVHPAGNPHFLTDPRRAALVAEAIGKKLAELDPAQAAAYGASAAAFSARMQAALSRWRADLAPLQGRKVLTQHRTLGYFFDWTGLTSAGELEPRPGTPPSPAHLARMVELARREGVKAVIVESYYDTRSGELASRLSGARLVVVPGDVGADPQARSYDAYLELLVRKVVDALRS